MEIYKASSLRLKAMNKHSISQYITHDVHGDGNYISNKNTMDYLLKWEK